MMPVPVLDFASVFVFALTGGLAASRAQLDFVGFLFLGCITAVGGGTIRDVILDREPVFWVGNPAYIGLACVAAVAVFFGGHRFESRYTALLWLDALALAIAVPAGVIAALAAGAAWPILLVMGVATGCLGGLMRDVVCNEVPLVLRQRDLYVTAALAGAAAAVAMLGLTPSETAAILACAATTFALRAGSLVFGWRIPGYRSRPPRV